jgi:hypothetical protein
VIALDPVGVAMINSIATIVEIVIGLFIFL